MKKKLKLNFCNKCGGVVTDKRKNVCDSCELSMIDDILKSKGKVIIQRCLNCRKVNYYNRTEYKDEKTICKGCRKLLTDGYTV